MDPRRKCLRIAAAGLLAASGHAGAAGFLDTPGAVASGIGVVAGWFCDAKRIEIQIDGAPPLAAAYGTDRPDTATICGKRDTGFGLLLNWGAFGPGPHTIRALADGVEFARRNFNVTAYGIEFLQGKSASVTVNDFPEAGKSTVLEWQQGQQSFVATEVRNEAPVLDGTWNGANLERRTNCASAQNNGQRGTYAQYDISTVPDFKIGESAVTGLTCVYNGSYRQDGMRRQASGTFSCSDGKQGDFTTTSFLVTANEMSIRMDVKLTGNESCTIDAIIGGSRF